MKNDKMQECSWLIWSLDKFWLQVDYATLYGDLFPRNIYWFDKLLIPSIHKIYCEWNNDFLYFKLSIKNTIHILAAKLYLFAVILS